MKRRSFSRIGVLLTVTLGLVLTALPARAAVTVGGHPDAAITTEVNDDAFTGGQSVSVTAPIRGELFAVGETVTVSTRPDRSIFAAGMTVSVPNGAGYDAFVGGQTVTLAGEYGHDVYVLGQTVVLEPNAHVKGSVYVMGDTITVHGRIDGQLSVAGGSVTSDAVIGRDARIAADQLRFTGGSIGGDLRHGSAGTVTGLDTVSVAGQTVRDEQPSREFAVGGGTGRATPADTALEALMAFLTMAIVGGLLILLVPARIAAAATDVHTHWLQSFLTGLVTLIVGPLVIGIALATLVGWPVAIVLGLLYTAALVASGFLAPILLGKLIVKAETGERPWRALLIGSAIVAVTTALPVIGWLPSLAVFVGLTLPIFGASLRWTWEQLRA